MRRDLWLLLVTALVAGCGGGSKPSTPVTPSPVAPAPPPAATTTARVVSTLNGAEGVGGATLQGEALGEAMSNADGYVTVQAPSGASSPLPYSIRVTAGAWVERQTFLRVPGGEASLSLIPQSINLTYFNEMCRALGGALLRWKAAPVLIVETSVLQYGSRVALEDKVPAALVERTMNEVRSGLALQSAGHFPEFASVEIRTTPAGASSTLPSGALGLTWRRGLLTGFGHVAYGSRAGGVVQGGLVAGEVALDFDWHAHGLPQGSRRDFFNVVQHELGHALGYSHTKVAPSFMYEVFLMSVSPQDQQAFKIFMQRPSGNRTPDVDPAEAPLNLEGHPYHFDIPRCAFLKVSGS